MQYGLLVNTLLKCHHAALCCLFYKFCWYLMLLWNVISYMIVVCYHVDTYIVYQLSLEDSREIFWAFTTFPYKISERIVF